MLESILDDRGLFRDYFQTLFFIHAVAERAVAGNSRAVPDLAVKHNADSFTAQIGFILGNGKPQIDIQPPARRAGVVLFLCGFPAAAVGFQNFHDLVIIGHGTEPAIKAGKENQIHLVPLHVFQHTQEVCALAQALPGGFGRVYV